MTNGTARKGRWTDARFRFRYHLNGVHRTPFSHKGRGSPPTLPRHRVNSSIGRMRLYRRTLDSDISAELCAASASFAEMAAVSAGVPQLGASLPSPQARGL